MANRLGYTEIEDFRRAIARGEVIPPAMYLGANKKKPIWHVDDVDQWLGRVEKEERKGNIVDMAKAVA